MPLEEIVYFSREYYESLSQPSEDTVIFFNSRDNDFSVDIADSNRFRESLEDKASEMAYGTITIKDPYNSELYTVDFEYDTESYPAVTFSNSNPLESDLPRHFFDHKQEFTEKLLEDLQEWFEPRIEVTNDEYNRIFVSLDVQGQVCECEAIDTMDKPYGSADHSFKLYDTRNGTEIVDEKIEEYENEILQQVDKHNKEQAYLMKEYFRQQHR